MNFAIQARHDDNRTYADWCYDFKSIDELESEIRLGPTSAVLDKWDLTHSQWRQALNTAIDMVKND